MGDKTDRYRADLRALKDWEPYLKLHSGLPGPRGNLELVAAVCDVAPAETLWRFSESSDEFLALCGAAGLGRLYASSRQRVMKRLHSLASDPRWRVREGVAMALQRIGDEDMERLISEMQPWADGSPFVQRAAAAGLCEPVLLKLEPQVAAVLQILDRITKSFAASTDRRNDGFVALRKGLGYSWSVAAAAAPNRARPYLERWVRSTDPDVIWVMRSNLGKARMAGFRDLAKALESTRAKS